MSRGVVYARVSSDEQAASGLRIEAQVESARRWAEQHGHEPARPICDEGVSGATSLDKRPGLLDAVAHLEKGDVLLVAKRDRFGRDPMVVAMIESVVKRKKCRVVSTRGRGDRERRPVEHPDAPDD